MDPITARRIAFSPTEVIKEVDEIDETYDDVLLKTASANIDRTQLWLNAQSDYMKAVCEDSDVTESFQDIEDAIPKTPEQTSPVSDTASPSKKSVRFVDVEATESKKAAEIVAKRTSPIHDGTFWNGWRHTKRSQRARDVFQHRQARAEAEHVKRTSCQKQHVDQLKGRYEITSAQRPTPSRPISTMLPTTPEDEKKAVIQRAERERQALEQMQTSSWHISAQKEINGGKLLTSPIVQTFKARDDVAILDLAGQVHCSWAWDVAAEHPNAAVFSTVSSDAEAHVAESTLDGPSNHFVVAAPKPWELPFESNYFDVISARNLYSHLKTTWPKGQAVDEWDLTLRECLRCLKPGGYLEFDLLDAELVHPESALQALGVEFAFNLKTRGYDPTSGKNFLPRLKRAGFSSIKRAWMVLPVGDVLPKWTDSGKASSDASSTIERTIGPNGEVESYEPAITGSTRDVRAMTGIVGARMWEQWMLKLNSEMGRSEERCLEGVAKALEEGGKGNAGWRCLVGWARKA
jgi:SAM-dependent methyltransferase